MQSDKNILDVSDLRIDLRIPQGTLRAVRGIGFSVAPGETLCIVGESGCGKSMTALAILGLLPDSSTRSAKQMDFNGRDLQALSNAQMRGLRGNEIGMIFQDPMTALNPCYTIGDQLEEVYLHHRKCSRKEARDRAVHLLGRVGITAARSRMKQYPHQLSGGLRQRILIAMALMCEPQLLIADEPTTALDVTIQAQILRLIKDLQSEFGVGVILITHDLGVVAQTADHVAVMYAGEVVEHGPVNVIFENPSHPYTVGLMSCVPMRGRIKHGGRLGAIPGTIPSLIGDLEGCLFRNRCTVAVDRCASEVTGFKEGDHHWRCIHERLPAGMAAAESAE